MSLWYCKHKCPSSSPTASQAQNIQDIQPDAWSGFMSSKQMSATLARHDEQGTKNLPVILEICHAKLFACHFALLHIRGAAQTWKDFPTFVLDMKALRNEELMTSIWILSLHSASWETYSLSVSACLGIPALNFNFERRHWPILAKAWVCMSNILNARFSASALALWKLPYWWTQALWGIIRFQQIV